VDIGGVGLVHACDVPGFTVMTGRPPAKASVIPIRKVYVLPVTLLRLKLIFVGLFTPVFHCASGKLDVDDEPTVKVVGVQALMRESDGCIV
jgi:hypothetical protein